MRFYCFVLFFTLLVAPALAATCPPSRKPAQPGALAKPIVGDPGIRPGAPTRPHPLRTVRGVLGTTVVSLPTPDLADRLQASRAAGAGFVMLPISWNEVQPANGPYRWQAVDQAVNLALAQGMGVVGVLGRTPSWACRLTGCRPEERPAVPPKDVSYWRAFVTSAVRHFKDRIGTWQLWPDRTMANFRGTTTDFLALLQAGSAAARAEDPTCRLIAPENGALDVAWIAQARTSPEWRLYDIVGLRLPVPPPADLVRPLATLASLPPAGVGKEVWLVQGPAEGDAGDVARTLAACRSLGVARVAAVVDRFANTTDQAEYLAAATATCSGRYLGARQGTGYLALAFTVTGGTSIMTWSAGELASALLGASDLGLPEGLGAQVIALGQAPAEVTLGGQNTVAVAWDPTILVLPSGPDLASFGEGGRPRLPAPPTDPQLAAAAEVSAGMVDDKWVEQGLYNERLRWRSGGGVAVGWTGETWGLRTHLSGDLAQDNPWYYFDVDDSFLYFDQGRSRVQVTVEVLGASGREKQGFNLYYDSTTGYRFSPWHWVETTPGWHTYTTVLSDANFANRNGYDFRLSATGSREDMTIRAVTVRKIPRETTAP